MSTGFNRRDFSKAAVGGRAEGAASNAGPGPGGRRRRPDPSWLHGVGNLRSAASTRPSLPIPDAKIVALCDVYAPYLNAEYDKVVPLYATWGNAFVACQNFPPMWLGSRTSGPCWTGRTSTRS